MRCKDVIAGLAHCVLYPHTSHSTNTIKPPYQLSSWYGRCIYTDLSHVIYTVCSWPSSLSADVFVTEKGKNLLLAFSTTNVSIVAYIFSFSRVEQCNIQALCLYLPHTVFQPNTESLVPGDKFLQVTCEPQIMLAYRFHDAVSPCFIKCFLQVEEYSNHVSSLRTGFFRYTSRMVLPVRSVGHVFQDTRLTGC